MGPRIVSQFWQQGPKGILPGVRTYNEVCNPQAERIRSIHSTPIADRTPEMLQALQVDREAQERSERVSRSQIDDLSRFAAKLDDTAAAAPAPRMGGLRMA